MFNNKRKVDLEYQENKVIKIIKDHSLANSIFYKFPLVKTMNGDKYWGKFQIY